MTTNYRVGSWPRPGHRCGRLFPRIRGISGHPPRGCAARVAYVSARPVHSTRRGHCPQIGRLAASLPSSLPPPAPGAAGRWGYRGRLDASAAVRGSLRSPSTSVALLADRQATSGIGPSPLSRSAPPARRKVTIAPDGTPPPSQEPAGSRGTLGLSWGEGGSMQRPARATAGDCCWQRVRMLAENPHLPPSGRAAVRARPAGMRWSWRLPQPQLLWLAPSVSAPASTSNRSDYTHRRGRAQARRRAQPADGRQYRNGAYLLERRPRSSAMAPLRLKRECRPVSMRSRTHRWPAASYPGTGDRTRVEIGCMPLAG